MNPTRNDIYELIENYLEGRLPAKEKSFFELRLARDANLRRIVQQYEVLLKGIKRQARQENINRLKDIESTLPLVELSSGRLTVFSGNRLILTIAAGIFFALLSTFVIYKNFYYEYQVSAQLFANYYKPYPNIVHSIIRGEVNDDSLERMAFQAYEMGKYDQALDFFYQLPEEKLNATTLFYMGNIYLQLDDPNKAILYYKLSNGEDEDFAIQANWYLGLAYLRNKQVDEARVAFAKVVQMNNSYSSRAKEILDKLKTLK